MAKLNQTSAVYKDVAIRIEQASAVTVATMQICAKADNKISDYIAENEALLKSVISKLDGTSNEKKHHNGKKRGQAAFTKP